jgi:hypothetical protein
MMKEERRMEKQICVVRVIDSEIYFLCKISQSNRSIFINVPTAINQYALARIQELLRDHFSMKPNPEMKMPTLAATISKYLLCQLSPCATATPIKQAAATTPQNTILQAGTGFWSRNIFMLRTLSNK